MGRSTPSTAAGFTASVADLRARRSADPTAEAHLRLAEKDLSECLEDPENRKPRSQRLPTPPGRPIGSSPVESGRPD